MPNEASEETKTTSYDVAQLDNMPIDIRGDKGRHFALIALVKDSKTKKVNKIPINAKTGNRLAWKKHPEDLLTIDEAIAEWKNHTPHVRAQLRVGALLTHNWEGNDDLIVIDIDHRPDLVKQARAHNITSTDIQAQIVKYAFEQLFYIEVSQSGEGLHLIQLGNKQDPNLIRNDKFEYYDSERWICLTGDVVNKVPDLGVIDSVFEKAEAMMFPVDQRKKKTTPKPLDPALKSNMTDDEIVKKAMTAKNGDKFRALFNGDSPSGDVSADDMSFVNRLAFWTQRDPKKMDEIFRSSGRMRPKWDEVHYSNGDTYGQRMIQDAIDNCDEVYHEPAKDVFHNLMDHLNKQETHSNKELCDTLANARMTWDKAHTTKGDNGSLKTTPITSQPLAIINILVNVANFAIIYNDNPKNDRNLYYYDYDQGIYSQDKDEMEKLVLSVVPEMTNPKTRQNLLDTIFKMPTDKVPIVQNVIASDEGKNMLAVGNGILNLETKQLTPYSPKVYVTSKIDTNYNENATEEPIYNGWSWSHNLKVISDGDLDKLQLLWQVCKAAIIGAYWLRQAVLLIDDGHGQTGKSTFEDALVGVVGKSNTAQLRLAEMSDETKLVDAVDKRLIVGDDNDVYTIIKRYDYLNPVISSELIRVRNYYQKSQSTTLHTFVLQSCNGIPPFANSTQAFFNRLKMIQFNHRHNAEEIGDWRVKNDYIKRQDFREWLLWYVVNKVHLGISLVNTEENKDLIANAQNENDTIKNFVENWMTKLESNTTAIPARWLFDFYDTACVLDGMNESSLKYPTFVRELMNNEEFSSKWKKERSRAVNRHTFPYKEVEKLMNLYNSTRWGKDLRTWLPITNVTKKQEDEGVSTTTKVVLPETYFDKIENFHNTCFVKR